jgi:hypothetical protein
MAETRRKFDHDFREARSGWSGRPASRSRRWPGQSAHQSARDRDRIHGLLGAVERKQRPPGSPLTAPGPGRSAPPAPSSGTGAGRSQPRMRMRGRNRTSRTSAGSGSSPRPAHQATRAPRPRHRPARPGAIATPADQGHRGARRKGHSQSRLDEGRFPRRIRIPRRGATPRSGRSSPLGPPRCRRPGPARRSSPDG